MKNLKSCGAVVFHPPTKEYLLLHYPGGHWDFVKGHAEEGESEQETALRELGEETGISDGDVVDGFREDIEYFYRDNGLIKKEVVFFLIKVSTKDVTLSHEHHDFVWLPFREALEKATYDTAKGVLKKAEKSLKSG